MAENPTAVPGKKEPGAQKRIPFSVPQRKLEVPPIPGYYLRWMRGTAARIAQAQRAGFEFVKPEEVELNATILGSDIGGNTDMGSRVSVVEGSVDDQGQAVRLFLMKQKLEYRNEDNALVQERNDQVAEALTAGYRAGAIGGRDSGETADDAGKRYVDHRRTRMPDLFRKKS